MQPHDHVFLGEGHELAERRTWSVIWLCGAMMVVEVVGGLMFGSIALVADGLHMSTHAGALLLAALAYGYARRHARDPRFSFGTGKLGDLAGFTSAIVLAMIALLVGWEAISRLLHPQPIHFAEAIPIACLGLAVNVASAWLLGGNHAHAHGHDHHGHDHHTHDHHGHDHDALGPRARIDAQTHRSSADLPLNEHRQDTALDRDNNMRSAVVHVIADAAVSVLVIAGLVLAMLFGWIWMDPVAGLIGSVVIASWAYSLVRDTGRILLDMNPDTHLTETLRQTIECDGDRLTDLHIWRLGPGHLAAELSVTTVSDRQPADYRSRLSRFAGLSHVTIEVHRQ